MGNEKKSTHKENSVPFGMNKYFAESVLPDKIYGSRKCIIKNTPNMQNENELMMLICKGTGSIMVNHEVYPLKRGVLICLGPFHSFTINPDYGSSIEYMEGCMNSGAYLYILSCPYLKVREMSVPQRPAIVQLTPEEMANAENAMNELCNTGDSEEYYAGKEGFFHMVWLFGLMLSRIYKDKKKSNK